MFKDKLSPLYRQLLPESVLNIELPEERFADCDNCHHCQNERNFRFETKCCDYHPRLPNYIVGAILSDESPELQEGKKRILEKIKNRQGVTPYGIVAPMPYHTKFQANRAKKKGEIAPQAEITELKCPYLNDGLCSIYKYRSDICPVFYCMSSSGQKGSKFWTNAHMIYDDQGNILCNAEIHWQPANSALYTTYKFDDLANQSVPLPILNKSVQVFDKVHHALLVIIHHGLVDTWTQLRHLVDLHLILATMTVAEIQTLEKRLTDSKLRYCYDYGIFLCQTILGYQSPATLTSSNSLPIKQQLLKRIVASDMVGKWSENRMKLYYYLRMRDSFVDQLKSIYYFLKFTWFDFRYKKNKMSKEEEH